jgi:fatty-acyl-CoA synthase
MQGYFAAPEITAQVLDAEGWLHTGDLATMDADGYVHIVGRKKEMIVRGGFKIYPREVEEFLFTHPGIQNAAVVGIPEPVYGESVWAFVVPKDGAELNPDEIIEFCRARIANFKVPQVVRIVDDLPMTSSGKVKKFKLREMAGIL